ncbi:helix-turn-helix transcriptional regulator [Agromyces sp. NBRC 114283]|jgi:hypothetical protein|nr:helix-turn-helix transcriptional regulator [Agromyces sp. NBRC 114283]
MVVLYARIMARPPRPSPREVAPGWPDVEAVDPVGEVARLFARNVADAIGDRSVRAVAKDTGVDHTTILSLLAGRAWPDLATIAKLELGLGVDLWPGRPTRD